MLITACRALEELAPSQGKAGDAAAQPRRSPVPRALVGCVHQPLGLVHAAPEGRVPQLLTQTSAREREEKVRELDPRRSIPALRCVLFVPPAPRDIGTAVLEAIAAVRCLERYLYIYVCVYIYSSQEPERITPRHGNDGNGDSISKGFKQAL